MPEIIRVFNVQLRACFFDTVAVFLIGPDKTSLVIPIQSQVGILEGFKIFGRNMKNVSSPIRLLLQTQVGIIKASIPRANEATVAFFDFLSTGNRRYHGQTASNQGQ